MYIDFILYRETIYFLCGPRYLKHNIYRMDKAGIHMSTPLSVISYLVYVQMNMAKKNMCLGLYNVKLLI